RVGQRGDVDDRIGHCALLDIAGHILRIVLPLVKERTLGREVQHPLRLRIEVRALQIERDDPVALFGGAVRTTRFLARTSAQEVASEATKGAIALLARAKVLQRVAHRAAGNLFSERWPIELGHGRSLAWV